MPCRNPVVGRVESSRPDDCALARQNVGSRRLDPTYENRRLCFCPAECRVSPVPSTRLPRQDFDKPSPQEFIGSRFAGKVPVPGEFHGKTGHHCGGDLGRRCRGARSNWWRLAVGVPGNGLRGLPLPARRAEHSAADPQSSRPAPPRSTPRIVFHSCRDTSTWRRPIAICSSRGWSDAR